MAEFTIRDATIRYNLGAHEFALLVRDEGSSSFGLVTLAAGWSKDTARVEDCDLVKDESLPPGTVLIEAGRVPASGEEGNDG